MLTGLLFSRAFCRPSGPESWLEQWDPWRVPIGQWGSVFAPTGRVAHWCVIGHCVGVMAAHGVSIGVVFATSHPIHPSPSHPSPPCHPSHPPPLLSILTAERDGKNTLKFSHQRQRRLATIKTNR